MLEKYGIKETIPTRTNDLFLSDFSSVPTFEGRILVYEKSLAGAQLKTYGAGVNIYVNEFALYNYSLLIDFTAPTSFMEDTFVGIRLPIIFLVIVESNSKPYFRANMSLKTSKVISLLSTLRFPNVKTNNFPGFKTLANKLKIAS